MRPDISDEVIERLTEMAGENMAVDPEDVGIEKRLRVVLNDYSDTKHHLKNCREKLKEKDQSYQKGLQSNG